MAPCLDVATRVDETEQHLAAALAALRVNAVDEAIDGLKRCLGTQSAGWLLDQLRRDFRAHGIPPLGQEMAFRLGVLLRTGLGPLGPILPLQQRRARHEFINVVGTSYVRSFGGNPAFFPLFIGIGPGMLLLTEERAATTRRKFRENLRRVDTRRHTMLVIGSDPYYHVKALQKAGVARPFGATDQDLAQMDAVAVRHAGILADAQRVISGRLMLLCVTPTQDDLMDQLCVHLNQRLAALCQQTGVIFLDWWHELADPVTGHLKPEYCANAYPGDIHFSLSTTRRFMQILQRDGLLSEAIQPASSFDWSHVFECKVDAGETTRIWCEPSAGLNAFVSHKIALSHLSAIVANLVTCLAAQYPGQRLLMVNVREAFLPTAVPASVHEGCLAITDTDDNLLAGQMVLDFYGRRDIRLEPPSALEMAGVQQFAQVVLLVHPDTFEADVARCNDVLHRISGRPSIIVATPFPDRLGALDLGRREVVTLAIANRHIPQKWHDYTIAVAR